MASFTFLEELGDAGGSTDLADRILPCPFEEYSNERFRGTPSFEYVGTDSSRCIRQAEGNIADLDTKTEEDEKMRRKRKEKSHFLYQLLKWDWSDHIRYVDLDRKLMEKLMNYDYPPLPHRTIEDDEMGPVSSPPVTELRMMKWDPYLHLLRVSTRIRKMARLPLGREVHRVNKENKKKGKWCG
ncbi:hypothetical protein Tco_1335186 [Tanacetum coccineum]